MADSSQGILGSGQDLRVLLLTRGGGQVISEINPDSGMFTRRLDETSDCTLQGTVAGPSCCDEFEEARPWACEILVMRDGRDAWAGPVTEIDFDYGHVTIAASDLTAWWSRRVLPDECHFEVDLSDIFLDYHNAAMASDPSPNIVISANRTGILGDRQVFATDYDYAWDHIQELTRTGLDFTAFGRTVMVGGEEVAATPYVTLSDEQWVTPPKVQERGNDQATRVIVRGNSQDSPIRGIAEDVAYTNFYGLLERVFNEAEIRDTSSANVAARTRLELLKEPTFIVPPQNAALRPTAPITLPELIPGIRVRVDSKATCRKLVRDFRLQEVSVDFNGSVSITLQPLGTIVTTSTTEPAEANGSNCVDLPSGGD